MKYEHVGTGCLQLTFNCHKEGPLAPVHHTDPPNIMSHEWLLSLQNVLQSLEVQCQDLY